MALRQKQLLTVVGSLLLILGCGKQAPQQYPNSQIMAKVGDRTVTYGEYLRRAEYTIRPLYCRSDNMIHRKIVLNSIIGEKLLAMEMEKTESSVVDEGFETYLQGRKEQAMRQLYRYDKAFKGVEASDELLQQGLRAARRTYEVSYFSVSDSLTVGAIGALLDEGVHFDSIYAQLGGGGLPSAREVSWFDEDQDVIREALFTGDLKRDAVLGPIQLPGKGKMFLRILGWKDQYSLSETANQTLWDDVVETVEKRLGRESYREHVSKLMAGKQLLFEAETFRLLVEDLAEIYLIKRSRKENVINEALWDIEQRHVDGAELKPDVDYLDRHLFTFDERDWTVKEVYALIAKHPLVFRDTRFPMDEFANQVRMAIADLLRDEKITETAYAEGYAERLEIQNHVKIWEDHYKADLYKRAVRRSVPEGIGPMDFLETYMNPIVDSLQVAYSDEIFINTSLFDSTKLSRIDMFVTQGGVPYPIMVPSFPLVYTEHALDYGKVLEND